MMMTYDEEVHYIEEIPKFTKKTALEHTDRLLDELGHPEQEMKVIHVAGTNGKGSTCAYLNAMLMEGGYKVGLFTSPHLIRINERYMICGEPIDDDTFLWAFDRVMEAVKIRMDAGDTHPTYFETLFLMGMLIFQKEKVDYAVLEVGMGGRLDATNVIRQPLACIITSISLDHTEYLGETIPEIASQKAGIIKPGVPVVFDGHDDAASAVIRKRAEELGSPAYELEREMYRVVATTTQGLTFDFGRPGEESVRLSIPQAAEYQMMNAALAFFTMRLLTGVHHISEDRLIAGTAAMRWPCRMETVMDGIIIDGAHNADGIAEFVRTVEHFHKDHEITLLFSAVKDKRYEDMVRELAEGIRPERVVTTKISGYRELSEDVLADLFIKAGCGEVIAEPSPERAFDIARAIKGDGMMFCVGSLYLAGELKKYCKEITAHD